MKLLNKTIKEEYIYDSEEEKFNHSDQMVINGYIDSGQLRKDINMSLSNPDYKIYGCYYKYEN